MALTLRQATDCIARGLAKAEALGFRVAVAVVDDAGQDRKSTRLNSSHRL